MNIDYTIKLPNNKELHYSLEISADTSLLQNQVTDTPKWTKLDYCKCENCTLNQDVHEYCPVALNMVSVLEDVKNLISHTEVSLIVKTTQRTTIVETTMQKALSSLMGLIMAVSDCPHTLFFRPLAQFHLPVASQEETMFRALSAVLISEYLSNHLNYDHSLIEHELSEIYENMQLVNEGFTNRIRRVTKQDAPTNAVISLHALSCSLPMRLDECMNDIRKLFIPAMSAAKKNISAS